MLQSGLKELRKAIKNNQLPTPVNNVTMERTWTLQQNGIILDLTAVNTEQFLKLQKHLNIDPVEVLNSLVDSPLGGFDNPALSGSEREFPLLMSFLNSYVDHLTQPKPSLIVQFLGVFRIKTSLGHNIPLLLMPNILPAHTVLDEKYDMKGAKFMRSASATERAKTEPTLKDNDFFEKHKVPLTISNEDYLIIETAVLRDTEFMDYKNVMDYSFLLGMTKNDNNVTIRKADPLNPRILTAYNEETQESYTIYIGIIDILNEYNFMNTLATELLTITMPIGNVEIVPPSYYGDRFCMLLLDKIFNPAEDIPDANFLLFK
eukprot:Pgem_evm2s5560